MLIKHTFASSDHMFCVDNYCYRNHCTGKKETADCIKIITGETVNFVLIFLQEHRNRVTTECNHRIHPNRFDSNKTFLTMNQNESKWIKMNGLGLNLFKIKPTGKLAHFQPIFSVFITDRIRIRSAQMKQWNFDLTSLTNQSWTLTRRQANSEWNPSK